MRISTCIRSLSICVLALLLPTLASAQGIDFIDVEFDGVDGVDGLAGPRFVAVSPDGKNVYVAGEGDSALAVFKTDRSTGTLSFVEAQFDGVNGVDGLAGADAVAVSPDGKHVYAAAAFEAGISVFSRDRQDGALTFVEAQFDGVGGVSGIISPVWISVSPDGANVYVSGFSSDAIAVFERDRNSGALSFVEAETNGTGGVTGINGAFGHAVSRDGRHVYVTGLFSSAVAVFERDHSTGELDFVSAVFDGTGGINGIGGARSVAISPNGQDVYVAGLFDSAVAVFERDRPSGELTFVEAEFDGVDGVDGIAFASSVVVDQSGQRVYAVGFVDDAVAVFDRNPASGELTFVEAEFDGIGGVDGINGVLHLATSPNGKHVYAPGFIDSGLAVFERTNN